MLDLLRIGSGLDEVVEHADWVEFSAIHKADQAISREDLSRAIRRAGSDGDRGAATEDRARDLADQAFDELSDRAASLSDVREETFYEYPFELVAKDQVLRYRRAAHSRTYDLGLVYLFLLCVTRHSMEARDRVRANIDPTKVFERLCAEVLYSFFGGEGNRSRSLIIGTAREFTAGRRFPKEVDTLCSSLGEGGGWNRAARSPGAGDGGLDVAVWREFRDGREGTLVAFAQCKTGTNWRRGLSRLRPRAFCQKYMSSPLLLVPQAIYMVPCRINRDRWRDDTLDSDAILFDRCRVVDYSMGINRQILKECRGWLGEAIIAGRGRK